MTKVFIVVYIDDLDGSYTIEKVFSNLSLANEYINLQDDPYSFNVIEELVIGD